MNKTIKTTWEVWQYEVWGNKQDGYDVNDRWCVNRSLDVNCKIQIANENTPQQFEYAGLSDYKIKKIFGVSCKLYIQGDDIHYYVERASDGYPIGELHCISHKSLSPIISIE